MNYPGTLNTPDYRKGPFMALVTRLSNNQYSEAGTRLHGRRLILARVLWIMLAVLTLGGGRRVLGDI